MKLIDLMLGGLLALMGATPALSAESAPAPAPAPAACSDDPLFRQQDFTLGTWDVYAGSLKAAQVVMRRAVGGCAISEEWTQTGGRPGNGIGIFSYSRVLQSWRYLWSADNGSTTAFTGTQAKPGEMLYVLTHPLPQGGTRVRHFSLSLMPDGRVHELSLGSNDNGKTWVTDFELIWVKVGQ